MTTSREDAGDETEVQLLHHKVRLRRAQHEDYEAVMNIDRAVFGGMDYLNVMYHHYIRHPHILCHLAEINGQVVGLRILYVVDGGKRMVGMTARLLDQYKKQRILKALEMFGIQQVLKAFPDVKVLSAASANEVIIGKALQGVGDKPHRIWNTIYYNMVVEDIPHAALTLDDGFFSDLVVLSKDDVYSIDDDTIDHLFGEHVYIEASYNWFPLSVNRASLAQLEREGPVTVSHDNGGRYQVISFSNSILTSAGICLRFHLRHTGASSPTLGQHVIYHMRHAYRLAPDHGRVMARIDLPCNVPVEEVMSLVTPLLGQAQFAGFGISADLDLPKAKL